MNRSTSRDLRRGSAPSPRSATARRAARGTGPRPAACRRSARRAPARIGAARPISSEYGRLTTSGGGSSFSQSSSLSISLRWRPCSPCSIETVMLAEERAGRPGSRAATRSRMNARRVPQPVEQRGVCRNSGDVLLQVDADAAEEHAAAADVRLVGQRRRVDGQQRDVVAARHQLGGQRVVAQAAAAVHRRRAGGEREDAHRSRPLRRRSVRRALNRAARVEVLEQVALVRLVPADLRGRDRRRGSGGRRAARRAAARRSAGSSVIAVTTSEWPEAVGQLVLAAPHDAGEREQELAVGQRMLRRRRKDDRRQQVGAAVDRRPRARRRGRCARSRRSAPGSLEVARRSSPRCARPRAGSANGASCAPAGRRRRAARSAPAARASASRDLARVAGHPDARGVHARAAAVVGDRRDHHVEVAAPSRRRASGPSTTLL